MLICIGDVSTVAGFPVRKRTTQGYPATVEACPSGRRTGTVWQWRLCASSEPEAHVRWRCSQPPLHVQRCGGAESRPPPNTPLTEVDLLCWQPCHSCHGTLQVLCPHCDGEGSLPIETQFVEWVENPKELECSACRGSGFLDCQECLQQGFIPRWNDAERAQAGRLLEER
jgi:hypothetical protein